MTKTLRGGSFNLEHSREPLTVKAELSVMLFDNDLDFLCVQEAVDYWKVLNQIDGYVYYASRDYEGGSESGILVKETHKVTFVRYQSVGDGWITYRGKHRHAPTFPRLTINGWFRIGSMHMPPSVKWVNESPVGPSERVDDYIDLSKKAKRFFRLPGARVIVGDWNEPADTTGEYSPNWVASKTNAMTYSMKGRTQHIPIDFAIAKGCVLSDVRRYAKLLEDSDHEPLLFTVTQGLTPRQR